MLLTRFFEDRYYKNPYYYSLLAFSFVGFLLYVNTFRNYWSFDDYFVILNNPDVISIENFIKDSYKGRPLRELSFMVDYHLFGFIPTGWHFQNILWHVLNSWLVFVLSSLIIEDKKVAWITSLLFLSHPIQVEVVAQISHRKDSLSLFFVLLSVIIYAFYKKKNNYYVLILLPFFIWLALLSKENSFLIFLFIFLCEVFCFGKKYFILKNKTCLVFMSILSFYISWSFLCEYPYVEKSNNLLINNGFFSGFDFLSYFSLVIKSWGHVFFNIIFPFNLSVNYYIGAFNGIFDIKFIIGLTLFLLYFTIIYYYRNNKYLLFSFLWFGVFFIPTSNIIPINHLAADRYMYAPSVGIFMALSFFLVNFMSLSRLTIVFSSMIIFFSFMTIQQNEVWHDNATLWKHSLKVNPESAQSISNVGIIFYCFDDDRNIEMQMRAREINPYYPFAEYHLAKIYDKRGDEIKALQHYENAYKLFKPSIHGMYKEIYSELKLKIRKNDLKI